MDRFLGTDLRKGSLLHINVPLCEKYDAGRTVHSIPVKAPHEEFDRELANNPHILENLEASIADNEWTLAYREHPVVLAHPAETVAPVALYVDGFLFSKTDGAIGFYVYNLLSGMRHLAAILRKSTLCSCGCLGWCSIYTVLRFLAWSFGCGVDGVYPSVKMDGAAFDPADSRFPLCGKALKSRFALVHIKGDWAEFTSTFGSVSWAHKRHPCFLCKAPKVDLCKVGGFSAVSLPFELKTYADYEKVCSDCEIWVRLDTQDDVRELAASLSFDKRPKGGQGRCLDRDIPKWGLVKMDRLEPCDYLQDIGALSLIAVPNYVLFWRVSKEEGVKHRNPLFGNRLGVSVSTMAIDQLHCVNLGVLKEFVVAVFWACLLADVLNIGWWAANRLQTGVLELRKALFSWYDQRSADFPGESIHRMQNLTPKMLGKQSKPSLRTKAAETKFLLYFAVHLCRLHKDNLRVGPAMLGAGEALERYMVLCDTHGRKLSPAIIQEKQPIHKQHTNDHRKTSKSLIP